MGKHEDVRSGLPTPRREDPVNHGSQNPIAYRELAEEAQFRLRQCACCCGETGERDFLPGHELRAIQARIRAHFGSSPLRFIQWLYAQVDADELHDATVQNADNQGTCELSDGSRPPLDGAPGAERTPTVST